MAATRYWRFLKLCEDWPVEETKQGRDLGAFLRQRVAQAFREGESTQERRQTHKRAQAFLFMALKSQWDNPIGRQEKRSRLMLIPL
ncbi:RNA-binding protein 40 [Platysternon megacephalum]|uniref:Mitochondrial nucleoid factor 1 n=1 Tax=Platysternon megacephalum TaxID=55544 RepID=A0A4D9E797_9SAUR|nr:RNA-binding protein 40 [Platysternon megacephalum]